MARLLLTSFQPLGRVEQLRRDGVLRGDWAHVPRGRDRAYRLMAAKMLAHGIDCGDASPMWAFPGRRTWGDAFGLIGLDEAAAGWAALVFTAPEELVMLTDYDEFCCALGSGAWVGKPVSTSHAHVLGVQATLPRIDLEWVVAVTPLPRHDIVELDWDTPV